MWCGRAFSAVIYHNQSTIVIPMRCSILHGAVLVRDLRPRFPLEVAATVTLFRGTLIEGDVPPSPIALIAVRTAIASAPERLANR